MFTLKGTAQDNSGTIQKMEFYIDSDTTSACSDNVPKPAGSIFQCSWSTSAKANGSHSVKAKAYDASNNAAFSLAIGFKIDNAPPTGSVRVANGAVYTRSESVTLSLSASDTSGVAEMCISNTNSCSVWEPYKSSKSWTLTSGNGTKMVYAWFKDKMGNSNTSPFSDSIVLDTIAPSNPTTVNSTSHTTSVWSKDRTVDMSWFGATDSGSGVWGYSIVWDRSPSTVPDGKIETTGTKRTNSLVDGNNHYFHIRTIDKAGNPASGAVPKGPFFIDGTPPTDGTLNATAGSGQVSLSWTPTSDAMSGLATTNTYKLVFSTSGTPSSKCTNGAQIFLGTGTSFVHNSLPSGTPHYYRVCAFDKAGNVSTGATRSATP